MVVALTDLDRPRSRPIRVHSLNMGDDEEEVVAPKKQLSIEFDLKNLGKLKHFLSIEVAI